MNMELISESIEEIIKSTKAITDEIGSSDGGEAQELYDELESAGITTEADEIVVAVEFHSELESNGYSDAEDICTGMEFFESLDSVGSTDLDTISSALELWESVDDASVVEPALEVYEIVESSSVHRSELEGSLELVEEWNQRCAHTWEDPASIANDYEALRNIVEVFSEAFGKSIDGVDDAVEAVRVLGNKSSVSDEERALLNAISALCGNQRGTSPVLGKE